MAKSEFIVLKNAINCTSIKPDFRLENLFFLSFQNGVFIMLYIMSYSFVSLLIPIGTNVVSWPQAPRSRLFKDFMILLASSHYFCENDVLFPNIGARVLDLWLDMSFGPKWPKFNL